MDKNAHVFLSTREFVHRLGKSSGKMIFLTFLPFKILTYKSLK